MASGTVIMSQMTDGLREEEIFSLEAIDQLGETMRSRRLELETLLDTNEALRRTAFTGLAKMQALFKAREEELEVIEHQKESSTRPSLEDKLGVLEEELCHERKTSQQVQVECALLRKQVQATKEELEQFKSAWCTGLTPRQMLMQRVISRYQPGISYGEDSSRFSKDLGLPVLALNLMTYGMDAKMTSEMSVSFSRSLDDCTPGNSLMEDIWVQTCHSCHKAKFFSIKTFASPALREFPDNASPTSCCSKPLCSECLIKSLTSAFGEEWCNVAQSELRYKCPQPSCDASIKVENRRHLGILLNGIKYGMKISIMKRYDNITSLRNAVQKLVPQPGPTAFSAAAALHEQLVNRGKMSPFMFQEKAVPGRLVQVFRNDNHDLVQLCDVDHRGDTTLSVPLFTDRIKRSNKAKECSVCTESISDLQFNSLDEWMEDWKGFHGRGMWTILKFPEKLGNRCTHDIDVCTSCFQTYLQAQLQQRGRECCDNLTCPSFECGRTLEFDEIRLYAGHENFEKYDKFCTLDFLSKSPNFRWCLREQCSNGEIYENGATSPCVTCTECNFRMCFTHQAAWHEGYTCAQLDNLVSYKDASSENTRHWLVKNTKPCPGCNAPLERRGGCYHMTCSSCQHQFCWQCLADWGNIQPRNRAHRRTEHKEGCYFRGTNTLPTNISGPTLQDEINRIER
ncbi:hypothetical protein B0J13DRAFT_609705 [Dactylonectria estremocensis]|uniref:RBR-type E3 ubiquitin transferase n=1 Tax=Dactylonectria estremocensis TaxID=1079267 RepID=A0A9P9EGT9_9HYPO|nr:hypothetical protein B0J13DRAFT_609705 [Dactylonectria estremocensis]